MKLYHPPLVPMPDIPVAQHFGAFGVRRKHDVHGGVDLYCAEGTPVHAIEDGIVVSVIDYTGMKNETPWWNDTRAIYIEGDTAVMVYGEIQEKSGVEVGLRVKAGEVIGRVKRILKKDKGKPTSMLHFAMKPRGYKELLDKKIYVPNLDPTLLLLQCKLNSIR